MLTLLAVASLCWGNPAGVEFSPNQPWPQGQVLDQRAEWADQRPMMTPQEVVPAPQVQTSTDYDQSGGATASAEATAQVSFPPAPGLADFGQYAPAPFNVKVRHGASRGHQVRRMICRTDPHEVERIARAFWMALQRGEQPAGYAQAYLKVLKDENLIVGYPDGTVRPKEFVTFQRVATVIGRVNDKLEQESRDRRDADRGLREAMVNGDTQNLDLINLILILVLVIIIGLGLCGATLALIRAQNN